MKKLILSVLVAGSLMATSCKKAKEAGDAVKEGTENAVEATENAVDAAKGAATDAVEATKGAATEVANAVESAIEGVSIPEFKDPKVGEHLKAYAEHAKNYIAAKGDVAKNADLAKKGVELAEKTKEVLSGLDAEGVKKFNTVLNKIQAKMTEATK